MSSTGIAEVLHIVFTELDGRKTQGIRKRHGAARLRPSAARNRSPTRISPTRRWACSHNCCATGLCLIKAGSATWRPGSSCRCRYAESPLVVHRSALGKIWPPTSVKHKQRSRGRAGAVNLFCGGQSSFQGGIQSGGLSPDDPGSEPDDSCCGEKTTRVSSAALRVSGHHSILARSGRDV